MVDENEIRQLWKDPDFSGSFSGLLTFQNQLRHEKNINLSLRQLRHIMRSEPDYVQHITHRIHFPTREYSVHGFLSLVQADLTQPKPQINGFKYLLVCIDIYTLFIWAFPLPDKRPKTLQIEFKKIFDQYGKPDELQSDEGGEFTGCSSFFKKQGIYFHTKRGRVKANYAELAILWLKKKIFTYLHTTTQDPDHYDWPKAVPGAVLSLNRTYHKSLGYLRPIDLDSKEKAVQIDRKIGFPKEPNFDENKKNEEKLKKKSDLKLHDYVYIVATNNKAPIRSTDRQVI